MFWLLLSGVYTSQGLFQLPMLWQVHKKWEGAQPGQWMQTDQRAIPYHRMSCPVKKLGGVGRGVAVAARGLAGRRSAGGERLYLFLFSLPWVLFLSLSFVVFLLITIHYYYSYYFVPIIKLFLSQPTSFLVLFQFSPPSHRGGSERAVAWCLAAGWG